MNMSNLQLLNESDVQNEINLRTNQLMFELEHRETCKIDRGFFWLMLVQWILGVIVACVVSPQTWIGQSDFVHLHVWFAFVFGACVSCFPMWLVWTNPGALKTRVAVAIAQAIWTGLLIHLTGGRIETHFHAFASLAFLAAYREIRILVLATAVIAIDHFVRGMVWPISVYGVEISSGFRFVEHVGWLLFMNAFLMWSCVRHHKSAFKKYHRRAVLEEQAKLSDQLIKVSREAGKAEIATGVLHNVGNVMNSVNVSTDTLRERMQARLQSRLKAAHTLLQKHELDLPEFFSSDERGAHFVPFIGQLTNDVDLILEEVNDLKEKLSHVNSVVASQQNLATMSAMTSTFDPRESVKSAVKLFIDIFQKSDIEITCEFEDVPMITSDNQRLIQVLVNLIRNAKHAIDDSGSAIRTIEMKVHSTQQDIVVISVKDSGIGIKPEDMDKIFQHGFSTRKDRGGHGFGLHHTGCILQELKGELQAHSEGIGKGATFNVQLPASTHTDQAHETQMRQTFQPAN